MSEATGQPAGFWSYTHQDNDQDDGRILRLSERIRAEYALLTGEDLDLFVDREGISWGNEWRSRIDGALDLTAFFIPVITPRYFTRDECRRELMRFATEAKALGVSDLLLPIYYVHVVDLREDSDDEAMAVVARTQYEDWRDLRLLEEGSAEYRQAVNRLARRLAEIAADVASRPTVTTAHLIGTGTELDDEDDDEPGLMDVLARGEEALPRWARTIQEFPEVINKLTAATSAATEDIARSDRSGKGFAGRVQVSRQLAHDLTPVAGKLQELGQRYSSELREVDPVILAFLRVAEEGVAAGLLSDEDREAVVGFVDGVRTLIEASEGSVDSLRNLITAIGRNLSMSRDLRPVLKRLQVGIRNVVDAQAVIDEWRRRLDEAPPLS